MHKKIQGKTGAQNSSQKKKIVPIKMLEKNSAQKNLRKKIVQKINPAKKSA